MKTCGKLITIIVLAISAIGCEGQTPTKKKAKERTWYVFFHVNVHSQEGGLKGWMYVSNIIEVHSLGDNIKLIGHNACSQIIHEYFDDDTLGTIAFEYYDKDYSVTLNKRIKFINEYPQSAQFELKDYPKLLYINRE